MVSASSAVSRAADHDRHHGATPNVRSVGWCLSEDVADLAPVDSWGVQDTHLEAGLAQCRRRVWF
jgi:hypothetical protein